MPGAARRLATIERERLKPRLGAERPGRHLVHRHTVEKALPWGAIFVGPRQPKRAAVVPVASESVPQSLHDAEIGPVLCEWLEQRGERVVTTRFTNLRIPLILRHAPAEAEEDEPLGWSHRGGSCRKPPEAERLKGRQPNDRRTGDKRLAA